MSRLLRFTRFVLPSLLAVLCTCSAAQSANTSLRGVVRDPQGAVIAGADIILKDAASGQLFTAVSKSSGDYQLLQIPPAKYAITVTSSGFSPQTKTAELLVNQPANVDFVLTIQASNEVVDVSAAAQTLNVTDATLGSSTNNQTIQALPSETRNVPDLLSLQPGVLFIPNTNPNPALQDSRSGTVNGGRSDQGNVTLDGVDDNDQVRGLAFTGVLRETQDSVEEFRVVTGGANADSGRSSGAQISLVTKSGTNKFHGAAYEYFRPSNTVANDYFNKQGQLASGLDNRPPKLIRNIFGGDLGGPVLKDKLFFFSNYEGERLAESQTVTRITPTASYQQGVVQYQAVDGSTATISPTQLSALDAGCQVCNTPAYPFGPGVNPSALNYLRSLPTANGNSLGDGGVNSGSYTFSSPNPRSLNTSIVRLDYIPASRHRLFARGNLQKDVTAGVEQFPGQGPSFVLIDNTKGMTFGDTWTVSSKIVNDIRYGYIRQGYSNIGIGSGDYVTFRFLDTPTAQTRNTTVNVPTNNLVDNFSVSSGNHTIQLGGNWRLVHQNRNSTANSFSSASSNPYWLAGNPPKPESIGLAPVDGGFGNSYQIAYANLVGTVPSVMDVSNYHVDTATTGTLLADGAALVRHFKANEYEGYVQDQWRIRTNLTLTAGARWTILQTPYETSGQQVTPTIDTHAWFTQREAAAIQGEIYEPNLAFAPSGPTYGRPGFWPKAKNNIAPRLALAFSPDSRTSIRAGAGIYYDHYGQGLINTFDQNGAFGLSNSVTNPAGVAGYETSSRFTGRHSLPFNNGGFPANVGFPFTPLTTSTTDFAITWGIDSKLKTPYTEAYDLSIQHEFPGGFTFELAYVGRYGQHLLQSLDLAEPTDFVDPQGGGDYYTNGTILSKLVDQNGGTAATVPALAYFEHLFPYMANQEYAGESATQAIYDLEWAPYRGTLGATTSLADIDFYCNLPSLNYCAAGHQPRFWQNQFASLYALSTIGKSYYNAAEFTLRHPFSHGLQFDVNYTFSKSIDWGSDAERTSEFSNGVALASSEIQNSWKPYLNRAVSDFDTRSLLTIDWLYQLPFGRDFHSLGASNHLVEALIGGWQSSGIFRTTSGLPFSLQEPGYTTNWQIPAYGIVVDPALRAHKHFDAAGNVLYFNDASAINNGVSTGAPVRLPYPGEAGQRNNFRGDGYFGLDSGLSKAWALHEYGRLKFAWEVYNVTNSTRFDPFQIGAQLTQGNLGSTSSPTLTQPRRMQFSLRYDF